MHLHADRLPPEVEHELFDPRRFPVLGAQGRAMLRRLRGHPGAPLYRNFSGHRLTWRELQRLRWRHWRVLHAGPVQHGGDRLPAWAWRFAGKVWAQVPARRASGPMPRRWADIEPMQRADLSARLQQYLPAGLRLDASLICFTTSGTTGHPLRVPSHPHVAAEYLAYHQRALRLFGVVPQAGAGDVGIVLAGFQRRCFTYVSVNPLMGECGLAKINLAPHEWRSPDDRSPYLDALAPELISGDPVSLAELAALPLLHRPRALLSTSMHLSPGLREQLQARFGSAPVVDLYSMNEVGPVGAYLPACDGFVLLQPRLHVEVLDPAGRVLPLGAFGEVTVSGGFNPCLPLLRYRTGDHARLVATPWGLALRDLQGRPPVRFRDAEGRPVNNVEITQALKPFALTRFALHQHADASFTLRLDPLPAPGADDGALRRALLGVLGARATLHIARLEADDKIRQYTSDLPAD